MFKLIHTFADFMYSPWRLIGHNKISKYPLIQEIGLLSGTFIFGWAPSIAGSLLIIQKYAFKNDAFTILINFGPQTQNHCYSIVTFWVVQRSSCFTDLRKYILHKKERDLQHQVTNNHDEEKCTFSLFHHYFS